MRRVLSLLCLLGFLGGCSDDKKSVFVDFSMRLTVPAVHAVPESSQELSVAVAAMVSPKESLRHYRQLLNYVSRHMARDVLLVQKKTYDQLNRLFEQGRWIWLLLARDPTSCTETGRSGNCWPPLRSWDGPLTIPI